MIFAKKLFREIWTQKGQALAVLSVTSLGVLLFVTSGAAYVDLDRSYRDTRRDLALADLHVDVSSVSEAELDRVRAAPSIAAASARARAELPVEIEGAGTHARIDLRVLSLPDEGEPRIDKLLVAEGTLPERADEIILEKHLAEHHHLRSGDSIRMTTGSASRVLRVSGIASSAEYLWVARDEHDVMPSPNAFGVGWMRRDALRGVAHAAREGVPGSESAWLGGLDVAAGTAAGNQLLLDRAPGASDDDMLRDVRAVLGDDAVLAAVPADRLPGVRLLQMDVDGYKGMAGFFPFFFLGVGAFIVASILGRVVDAQRAVIGTFTALGIGRARILAHYLAYALVLGTAGALVGAIAGFRLAPAITREYAAELGIPFVHVALHWDLAGIGVALGAGVALLAGFFPAVHASRLMPAEAMRPPRPTTSALATLTRRLGAAPLALRMAVRDVLGRPLRSMGTALGVAAALVLVLTTSAMLESMKTTFSSIFDGARRYELRVDLAHPEALDAAKARFGSISGVTDTEGVLVLPVEMHSGDKTETVELDGIKPDAKLLRAMDVDGHAVAIKKGGIVVTRALAKALGVSVGDEVRVSMPVAGREIRLRIDGFADAALGKTATGDREELASAFGMAGRITSVAMRVDRAALDAARISVGEADGAVHVEDLASLRTQMGAMMGLGWVMVGIMLAFSVILASAILFNTATLGILERKREIATMRALGRTLRELGLGLTIEHAILCIVGLGIGLPLAVVAIKKVLALYSSDLFSFPFVLSPATVGVAFAGIVLVLLAAQWPALRAIARTPIAEAVRTRE